MEGGEDWLHKHQSYQSKSRELFPRAFRSFIQLACENRRGLGPGICLVAI